MGVTVVAVGNTSVTEGIEMDDGNPNSRTFLVCKGSGSVTVTATPVPSLSEAQLANSCWTTTGGTGILVFGTPGDGDDFIMTTDASQLQRVFGTPGYYKIVNEIWTPDGFANGIANGSTVIVVEDVEASTYVHEYGHDKGIVGHNTDSFFYIMFSPFVTGRDSLTPSEAAAIRQ